MKTEQQLIIERKMCQAGIEDAQKMLAVWREEGVGDTKLLEKIIQHEKDRRWSLTVDINICRDKYKRLKR
jgi:hypothetical protein